MFPGDSVLSPRFWDEISEHIFHVGGNLGERAAVIAAST